MAILDQARTSLHKAWAAKIDMVRDAVTAMQLDITKAVAAYVVAMQARFTDQTHLRRRSRTQSQEDVTCVAADVTACAHDTHPRFGLVEQRVTAAFSALCPLPVSTSTHTSPSTLHGTALAIRNVVALQEQALRLMELNAAANTRWAGLLSDRSSGRRGRVASESSNLLSAQACAEVEELRHRVAMLEMQLESSSSGVFQVSATITPIGDNDTYGTSADNRQSDSMKTASGLVSEGGNTTLSQRSRAPIASAASVHSLVAARLPALPEDGVVSRGGGVATNAHSVPVRRIAAPPLGAIVSGDRPSGLPR
jgi:hypothetical protein